MKTGIVQFLVAASAMFLLTGFQSARADFATAAATISTPQDGQMFYVGGSPGHRIPPTVSAASSHTGSYFNTGNGAITVAIDFVCTLVHADPDGNTDVDLGGGTRTIMSLDHADFDHSMTASGVFPEGRYLTSAQTLISCGDVNVTGPASVAWSVVMGEDTEPPSGLGGCQARKPASKKSRRIVSRIAL